MKQMILFTLILGMAVSAFAQSPLPEHRFASGLWKESGDRVYQDDSAARLARVNIPAPQAGLMAYEFNARYEAGAEDGHGGFGIHIFADSAPNGATWGCGQSYLLWLNYDEKSSSKDIPSGLSAQVYRSYGDSRMDLVQSYDLNEYADLLTSDNLAYPVPFKIWADGDTGEVRVYDPTDPELSAYFLINLDKKDLPAKGNWVALRTNGMKVSFAPGL